MVQRYGSVIKVAPGRLEEYKRLHAAVWDSVKKMIKECNLQNYSIYYKDGYLFSYYEYTGNDYAADMAKMAADPETQRWWTFCEPCQQPLESRAEGEWWATMEEVFHLDCPAHQVPVHEVLHGIRQELYLPKTCHAGLSFAATET